MEVIPSIGLGTFLAEDPAALKAAVHSAIEDSGYRHVDCAAYYKNQEIIGEALSEIFAKGQVKREEVWITSKVWNTKHRPDLLVKDVKKTLKELKLEYLDLVLVHWACAFQSREDDEYLPRDETGKIITENIDILETWKAMEECYNLGLAKHIGVSNFSIEQLERMRYDPGVKIQPYCNQVESHMYLQQQPMLDYLTQRKMYMISYTCLGRATLKGPYGYPLLQDPVLNEVAKEIGKTPAQTNLRFLLKLSPYAVVIPKSLNPANIKGNISLDFDLTQEQFEKLRSRQCGWRFVNPYPNWKVDALSLGFN
ncbi:oxidoreductase, aldo/keto reductase family protein [Trichomonas vaginalis G3]|uniref:Oxidoreductase, aldo/keto reductase family protein n=1 Tax=Trichomonas vaginalis (strain ATCC PRA-98 / G3) TaxID=412133 RepID=A2FPE2_TRIV3|nr:oxidoreductase protein [Trichomonas vaginalis G3]EAX93215.1 oxidoreductase, aldo/keto reductase family protein [Trichomonas vaginalis G3]KAI5539473.1 oxidoreductase protein [Trichomonas vaginalis G3]|eukprot:XP_001306145.1 oxidoreductase, aldo/keto reductase family protein [Trichomonas vaginalis G3]